MKHFLSQVTLRAASFYQYFFLSFQFVLKSFWILSQGWRISEWKQDDMESKATEMASSLHRSTLLLSHIKNKLLGNCLKLGSSVLPWVWDLPLVYCTMWVTMYNLFGLWCKKSRCIIFLSKGIKETKRILLLRFNFSYKFENIYNKTLY